MTIIERDQVRAAVGRALDLDCYGSIDSAIAAAARALCLPVEAVRDAMQPAGWCCERGENLGVSVCEECAEISAGYSAAMGVSPYGSVEARAAANRAKGVAC